jgi:hypothetical protein
MTAGLTEIKRKKSPFFAAELKKAGEGRRRE